MRPPRSCYTAAAQTVPTAPTTVHRLGGPLALLEHTF
jgi:hypothetical protein